LVLTGSAAALDELQFSDQTPPESLAISAALGPIFRMSLMCPEFQEFAELLTRIELGVADCHVMPESASAGVTKDDAASVFPGVIALVAVGATPLRSPLSAGGQ
jgi:hypothetical protein